MADSLNKKLQPYRTIWQDIKNKQSSQVLSSLSKDEITSLITDVTDALHKKDKGNVKNRLKALHKAIDDAHYLRALINSDQDLLLQLRGLKHVYHKK